MKGVLGLNDGFGSAWGAVTLLLVPDQALNTPRGTSSLLTLLSSLQTQKPPAPPGRGQHQEHPAGMIPGKEIKPNPFGRAKSNFSE